MSMDISSLQTEKNAVNIRQLHAMLCWKNIKKYLKKNKKVFIKQKSRTLDVSVYI